MRAPQRPQHMLFNDAHVVAYDIETIVDAGDEMSDGSFPPWPRHVPIAAALLTAIRADDGSYDFDLNVLMPAPDHVGALLDRMDNLLPVGATGITYNGRAFDNRVLSLQMSVHGRTGLARLVRQTSAGRFEGAHCDLADQMSNMGGARTVPLAELCRALGIPIKTGVSGRDVGRLWREGDYERIAEYVAEDAVATYVLWLHHIAQVRGDETLLTLPLAALAAWIETVPELVHLRPFATCRPATHARERAPALRAQAALVEAARRVERERTERAFGRPPF